MISEHLHYLCSIPPLVFRVQSAAQVTNVDRLEGVEVGQGELNTIYQWRGGRRGGREERRERGRGRGEKEEGGEEERRRKGGEGKKGRGREGGGGEEGMGERGEDGHM